MTLSVCYWCWQRYRYRGVEYDGYLHTIAGDSKSHEVDNDDNGIDGSKMKVIMMVIGKDS